MWQVNISQYLKFMHSIDYIYKKKSCFHMFFMFFLLQTFTSKFEKNPAQRPKNRLESQQINLKLIVGYI